MTPVYRQPDMLGPSIVFHYMRDESGVRTPISYQVDGGPWVTDEQDVLATTQALFARDAIYAAAMQAVSPILPSPGEDGLEVISSRRLDVGDIVVIGLSSRGLSAVQLAEFGAEVAHALTTACSSDLAAGRLALLWAD
jgi:hypothetical protein